MKKFYDSHSKHSINAGSGRGCTSSTSNSGRNRNNSKNHFATCLVFSLKEIANSVWCPYTWEYHILPKPSRGTL